MDFYGKLLLLILQSGLLGSSSAVLGADALLQLLKNYARNAAGAKKAIAVGVVGYPNVGKSSVINSLKRANVAKVGAQAGVTRSLQEVVLDSKALLISECVCVWLDQNAIAILPMDSFRKSL